MEERMYGSTEWPRNTGLLVFLSRSVCEPHSFSCSISPKASRWLAADHSQMPATLRQVNVTARAFAMLLGFNWPPT